jgi:hypothetical protein
VAVIFSAELIGPGFDWTHSGRPMRDMLPWLAELTGTDPNYGFRRRFLRANADYTRANAKGTRGVWLHWSLHPGRIYEAKYLTSARASWTRRYLTVTDEGEIRDLTREEAQAWFEEGSPQ